MKIGEEIIKIFGEKLRKDNKLQGKVREASFLESGGRLAAGNLPKRNIIIDNGGRRSGIDRRALQYAVCLPENRFGEDRRIRLDRRGGIERRSAQRSTSDRREYFMV